MTQFFLIGTQNDHIDIFHLILDALLAQPDYISNELQFFHLPGSRFPDHRKSVCIIKALLDGAWNDTFAIWTKRKIYLAITSDVNDYANIPKYIKCTYLNDKIHLVGCSLVTLQCDISSVIKS